MNKPPQTLKGYVSLAIAAVTCPCHVPIFLIVLGGTAAGAFLSDNLLLFVLGLTAIFLLALFRGLTFINKKTEQTEGSDSA